jgi:hypothetical protein
MIDQPQQKAFETFADRLDVKKLEIRNGLLIMVMKSIVRPCLFCGQKDHSKLEWHHPNPKDKLFDISKTLKMDRSFMLVEYAKVLPLCKDCHTFLHQHPVEKINSILKEILWSMNSIYNRYGIHYDDLFELSNLFSCYNLRRLSIGEICDKVITIWNRTDELLSFGDYRKKQLRALRRILSKYNIIYVS